MRPERILITGGAGFLGSALARRLYEQGHQVSVLDNFARGKDQRIPAAIGRYRGDIRNPGIVRAAVRNAEVIWHLAYCQGTQTFYTEPRRVIDVALTGMMNLLHACEEATPSRLRRFYLVSSSEAYQVPPPEHFPTGETVPLSVPDVTNPRYSYGAGKIACEVALMAYAEMFARATVVRPHNVYGPDMGHEHVIPQFAERMLALPDTGESEFPIQGTGAETRCFCYIDDAVDGLLAVHHRGLHREVYHLGGRTQEEISIAETAAAIALHYGRKIKVTPGRLLQGSPPRRAPDISKLERLGYTPRVRLREGLGVTLDWYADQTQHHVERRSG